MSLSRIVVVGAGPIGLEAALVAADRGHDVRVLERGRVAHAMRSWGHVTLFSPWRLNHSPLGRATLEREGHTLPDPDAYLTGAGHVERYLQPLADSAPLAGRVDEGCHVAQIGREGIGKSELIGGPRQRHPFRLLVERDGAEEIVHADLVLDCSGTYGTHNWIGSGNIPAPGERALSERIDYSLQDIDGSERERYAGQRVLLVGDGYSAATALDALGRLPAARVNWVSNHGARTPLTEIENDPLPERGRLARRANALAGGADPAVEYLAPATVERLEPHGDAIRVTLRTVDGEITRDVDRVLAHVGYRPERSIHRELQVHECWATFGPIKLAAGLLADTSTDCLAQQPLGPRVHVNPEPDFFILGAKSYGKNSSFLIHLGLQQVHEVFTLIDPQERTRASAAITSSVQE